MSASDKAQHKVDKLAGLAREKYGKLIGDEDQEQEGKAEKAKADLKDAGEKIKDAFRH
ncbi:CsbD family protein [Nocardia sp. NBC_01327]|uniref:CsbD family protein n=1 Tax=Nocardia sp. NBC_01327 TaxID=2903593 RepID=UPI002E0D965F|nr:CsbD family protein [Nocardia sp. NBC_01327]